MGRWGEHTDAIGNRLALVRWPKCFDQRLRGEHAIRAAVLPHSGDWRSADLIGASRSFNTPPLAIAAQPHPGVLPPQRTLMAIADPQISVTSIRAEAGGIQARLYSVKEASTPVMARLDGVQIAGLEAISGERLDLIGPFQIAHLLLKPGH